MANDLNYLYSVKKLLQDYYVIKRKNDEIRNKMVRETNVIKREANNKIAIIKNQIKKWYKTKTTFSRILLFLVVIGILFVGLYFKFGFFNLSLNDYLERCKELADSDRSYLLSRGNFPSRYTGALVGNILSVSIVYFIVGCCIMFNYEKGNKMLYNKIEKLLSRIFLSIMILILVYLIFEGLRNGEIGIVLVSGLFNGFVYIFIGWGLIFKASYPILIPFFLCYIIIFIWFFVLAKKEIKLLNNLKNSNEEYIKEQVRKINVIIDECNKKVKEKENSFVYYDNPYWKKVNQLPDYQQNLTTINSLIWAIEHGYAYDIVSARNYFDRKAHDESVRRKIAQIEQQTQQAVAAARDAASAASAAYSAAKQAQSAAEAPINVDIEIKW